MADAPSPSPDPITVHIPDEPQLDTPQSDAAIDDIVAEEADQVLMAEDAATAAQADSDQSVESEKHGHPIFWSIIALLVLLAFFVLYVLTTPGISLPFGL